MIFLFLLLLFLLLFLNLILPLPQVCHLNNLPVVRRSLVAVPTSILLEHPRRHLSQRGRTIPGGITEAVKEAMTRGE